MAQKILIIYTGGTFGSTITPNGLEPFPKGVFEIKFRELLSQTGFNKPFDFIETQRPILSSQATIKDWIELCRTINNQKNEYDGFIIIHGTDAMDYAAAFASFMLQGLSKPIIFTGAQFPAVAKDTDAIDNFTLAYHAASDNKIREVALAFNGKIFRGNRIFKYSCEKVNAFTSPNYPPLAFMDGDTLRYNEEVILENKNAEYEFFEINVTEPIKLITPLPDFPVDPNDFQNCWALIIHASGNGNVHKTPEMINALKRLAQDDAIVIIKSSCPEGSANFKYAGGSWLRDYNVVTAHDMTLAALFAKLHFLKAKGLKPDQIRATLSQPLCGEVSAD